MILMLPLNYGVLRLGERTAYPYICSPRQLITVLLMTPVEVALAHSDLSVQISHRKACCVIYSGLQSVVVEVASASVGRSVLTAELKTSSSFPSAAEVIQIWLKQSDKKSKEPQAVCSVWIC